MSSEFRDKFAIVGLGMTKVGHVPGYSARTLQTEAARLAIEDAGLRREDIDGCIHAMSADGGGGSAGDWTDAFPRVLGLPAKFYFRIGRGGAGPTLCIVAATKFLELDLAKYVLIAFGTNAYSGRSTSQERGPQVKEREGLWGRSFGDIVPVSHHSFFASRHMHEYGTTSRQLGAIAVSERQWACLNPAAHMYGHPMTIEDHQESPILVWPYHMLDICLISDGGTAFIVTTAERARDLRKSPVYIMGVGFGEHMEKQWWDKTNYTQLPVETAKADAFRMAGIELKDIDAAQLYDCFTAEVLFQLEDYGWCRKGEGGPFAEAGNIGPGGSIPVNTGGGQLSSHHHSGFTPFAEAVIQLRGEGGARQVEDAEICLASGHGGEILRPGMCSIHSTIILRR
ncbi:MAG: thiolase family protein [Deltaproteobacteria bacterium]|nr:MAG: thiolase family protein [Deltaproteobacteria bacterium]